MLTIFMTIQNEQERNLAHDIFERYQYKIHRLASGFFQNRSDVEDAVSDVAVKLVKSIGKFTSLDQTETEKLLFCLAKSACINKYNKDKKVKFISLDALDNATGFAADTYDVEEIVIKRNTIDLARTMLDSLNPLYIEIINLRYYGYSFVEIAELLDLNDTNIRVMFHRLKKKLLEQMGEGVAL